MGPVWWLHPVVCEVCGWGWADRCGTSAPGDGTDAGGRVVRAEDQADRGRTAPAGEPEVGLSVASVVAGRQCTGSGLTRCERLAVSSAPALSGEAGRVSGAGPGRARLGGGPGVDRRAGGHADRQEVPRLVQRLRGDAADAPARLQPAGPRAAGRRARRAGRDHVEGGDLGRGKRARAACGGYICFEDEAGFTRQPPKGRTPPGAGAA